MDLDSLELVWAEEQASAGPNAGKSLACKGNGGDKEAYFDFSSKIKLSP